MEKIFEFNSGVGDDLILYDDHIVIKHKGVLNFAAMGIHGDKTIYYTDLTSIQFKKAGVTNGHIQFSIMGSNESKGGILAAAGDENTIIFVNEKNHDAERVVEFVNEKLREIKTNKGNNQGAAVPVADELLKFKQLLDMGVISQEEFDSRKKELLNSNKKDDLPASTIFSEERQKEVDEIIRKEKETVEKKRKKLRIVLGGIFAVVFVAIIVSYVVLSGSEKRTVYKEAVSLMEDGYYEDAIAKFEWLEGYKKSAENIQECKDAMYSTAYEEAVNLMNEKEYEEAINIFESMEGYSDSIEKIEECRNAINEELYVEAMSFYDKANYESAKNIFTKILGYKDSEDMADECRKQLVKVYSKYKGQYECSEGYKIIITNVVLDEETDNVTIIGKNTSYVEGYEEFEARVCEDTEGEYLTSFWYNEDKKNPTILYVDGEDLIQYYGEHYNYTYTKK